MMNRRKPYLVLLLSVFIFGCNEQHKFSLNCPELSSVRDGYKVLKSNSDSFAPVLAAGNCKVVYIDQNGKRQSQSFNIRMWIFNRNKFCVYGDLLFDPQGMALAVDGKKFFAYAKPFGILVTGKSDSRIEQQSNLVFFNPSMLADFIYPVDSLSDVYVPKNNVFNPIACKWPQGMAKKIYFDRCSGLVEKINYIGDDGKGCLFAEFADYQPVDGKEKNMFPHRLKFSTCKSGDCDYSMKLTLNSARLWSIKRRQIKALFEMPDENNFPNRHKLD